MLDGRILAAVFASLAAIGAAMNGGALNAGDLSAVRPDASHSFEARKFVPESFNGLDSFLQNPEPHTDIQAALKVRDLGEQEFDLRSDRFYAANMTSVSMGRRSVSSDSDLVFYGFSGTVEPGEGSRVSGSSKGVVSSGVNISGRFNTQKKFETGHIRLEGVERARIGLEGISGKIESNSTSANIKDSDTELKINSFSGNMSIYPLNGTVLLSGKVDRLSAGDVSFGG